MHVDVVEDEAASVQVHDDRGGHLGLDERRSGLRPVGAHPDTAGVPVFDARHLLAGLLQVERDRRGPFGHDVGRWVRDGQVPLSGGERFAGLGIGTVGHVPHVSGAPVARGSARGATGAPEVTDQPAICFSIHQPASGLPL